MNWDSVADALSRVANDDTTICGHGVSRLWIIGSCGGGSLADT